MCNYTIVYNPFLYDSIILYNMNLNNNNHDDFKSKRFNHFVEYFQKLKNDVNIEIDEDSLKIIKAEIKKSGKSIKSISRGDLLKTLRKLKMCEYYNEARYIKLSKMETNKKKITKNIEEKILKMFEQIEALFNYYKERPAMSFFPYHYILYKFFELLELNDFLIYILGMPNTKYYCFDRIWEKICRHLKWYIRTSA